MSAPYGWIQIRNRGRDRKSIVCFDTDPDGDSDPEKDKAIMVILVKNLDTSDKVAKFSPRLRL